MDRFKFTNLKKFKLWAEFEELEVKVIEKNLKAIDRHGICVITFKDSVPNKNVYNSPIPTSNSL